jgi:4,5-DOPA dioxygenase extradiol
MNTLPTLFISHGSPMLLLGDGKARRFLMELGNRLPRPQAILVVSAHWENAHKPAVSYTAKPETIHDFGGFPQELYEKQYPVSGSPELAAKAQALLEKGGFGVARYGQRGLDHGAWVPLSLMYPEADIPVTQVSLIENAPPATHEKMGRALSALRDEDVLIIGSGSLTHNLYEFRGQTVDAPVQEWVSEFTGWMETRLNENRRDDILSYRSRAPSGKRNHPTEEHLSPLFVALGAAGGNPMVEKMYSGVEYGVIAMDIYAFTPGVQSEEDETQADQSAGRRGLFHFLPKVFFTRS